MPANDDPLLPWYLTLIEKEYVHATACGACDPVMVVLDLRDEGANDFAVSIFGSDEIENEIIRGQYDKVPPVMVFGWSRDKAAIGLAKLPGTEHMAEFAAKRLMTILLWSHESFRWTGQPRPNDLPK